MHLVLHILLCNFVCGSTYGNHLPLDDLRILSHNLSLHVGWVIFRSIRRIWPTWFTWHWPRWPDMLGRVTGRLWMYHYAGFQLPEACEATTTNNAQKHSNDRNNCLRMLAFNHVERKRSDKIWRELVFYWSVDLQPGKGKVIQAGYL